MTTATPTPSLPVPTQRSPGALLRDYLAHPDERVATGNLVALVLAWNTPFYPLWLRWAAGAEALPLGLLTLCVFPLFLAVPPLARRRPVLGRLLLALVGFANVLFCTWLFGEASGTELFLLPCLLLPGLLFSRRNLAFLLPLLGAPLVAYYALHGHYPPPPQAWSQAASEGMFALNAGSVGCLMAFFALLVARSPTHPAGEKVADQRAEG
jgi:hypothetical protein